MTETAHLWAIGYASMERAESVRQEIVRLGETHCMKILDTAVVVRYPDGRMTLNGKLFRNPTDFRSHTLTSFLAGLALAEQPYTGHAVRAWTKCAGGVCPDTQIDEEFVNEVQTLIKPGASALFVLDCECDMDAILQGVQGLGGTVLKTNVAPEWAKQIQSALAQAANKG